MECPYEDEARKFVHIISPVILDASPVSKMPVNLPNLKYNRRKNQIPYSFMSEGKYACLLAF
jgi:hypothetical protein